ncbi:MAG: hypothetical protein ABW007_18765 [Chitinophagaceae bacterium]
MAQKEKDDFVEILIGLPEWEEWSSEKFAEVKAAMKEHARKRTPEQKRRLEEFAKELKALQKSELGSQQK